MIRVPAGMAAPDTSAGEDPAATYLEAEAQTHERLEGESYDGLVTLIQAGEVPEYVYELMDVPFGQEISYLVEDFDGDKTAELLSVVADERQGCRCGRVCGQVPVQAAGSPPLC